MTKTNIVAAKARKWYESSSWGYFSWWFGPRGQKVAELANLGPTNARTRAKKWQNWQN